MSWDTDLGEKNGGPIEQQIGAQAAEQNRVACTVYRPPASMPTVLAALQQTPNFVVETALEGILTV